MNFSRKRTTENWYENIDWMVFLAISFSFNCTGRSASCFDCLLDRKTRNYVLTSWYFKKNTFWMYFLFILLLKPLYMYMYKNIKLKNCCVQIIPFITMNLFFGLNQNRMFISILNYRQSRIKRASRVIGECLHWHLKKII